MDEFGPLNLQPHPGKQWAAVGGRHAEAGRAPRRRRRATYKRPHGVRHLLPAYDLSSDHLYGHVKPKKGRTSSWPSVATSARCTRPRSASPSCRTTSAPTARPRPTPGLGEWAAANNVELAHLPFYASWLNRIEAQFTALRHFALDGTDHESHRAQARMIRRYIACRNRNAHNKNT